RLEGQRDRVDRARLPRNRQLGGRRRAGGRLPAVDARLGLAGERQRRLPEGIAGRAGVRLLVLARVDAGRVGGEGDLHARHEVPILVLDRRGEGHRLFDLRLVLVDRQVHGLRRAGGPFDLDLAGHRAGRGGGRDLVLADLLLLVLEGGLALAVGRR